MSRPLFGPGLRGDLAGRIQRGLMTADVPLGGVDEIYGDDTEKAVREFQRRKRLEATGLVDGTTWGALTGAPVPELSERSIGLTAAFEGHSYTLAVGNFDGAWLTWGIIGFTLCNGEVQGILKSVEAADPDRIDEAFREKAPELRQILRRTKADQKSWALANTLPGGRLAEPWRTGFAVLGNMEPVRVEQIRRAMEHYYKPAVATAAQHELTSELGVALVFDIHVQNGGIKSDARTILAQKLSAIPQPTERQRREAIAEAVAECCRVEFRKDVLSRKLAIARGVGLVHGRQYLLENWGLTESQAMAAGR